MRLVLSLTLLLLPLSISAQWVRQTVNTTASFRGLAVVNEKIVWASGTGGTVIRTIDGGKTWNVITVPGAEKLDFRDIEAFDANAAYILSIGSGDLSRIYKTTDGGKTWKLQFKNDDPKKFFDAIACWDNANCLAMGDPVDRHFILIRTINAGASWSPVDTQRMPPANEGEAAFAASGTCLITQGKSNAFLVTGGSDARVFKSTDRGLSWKAYSTPIVKGTAGTGIFSIAMLDSQEGIIVGGNYEKPQQADNNLAKTYDGGKTWILVDGLNGYRSGVAFVGPWAIAVGTTGSDVSFNPALHWELFDNKVNLNAVQAVRRKHRGSEIAWAVGPNGLIAKTGLEVVD